MSQYHHNFRAQDSHLDPPNEPEHDEYLSTCCTADRWFDTDICSRCKEHATFENEAGEVEDER